MKNINVLLEKIGYTPKNIEYFKKAFTHSSCEEGESYERTEFLGDAVLQLISSEKLFMAMPRKDEGSLSKMRAARVSEEPLAAWGRHIGIGKYIQFGRSELSNGGWEKDSIIADVVEALIGAIYLDRGLEAAKALVDIIFDFEDEHELTTDYKTALQEWVQREGENNLRYETVGMEGPAHSPVFSVALYLKDKKLATGSGKTKKKAEQQAARQALKLLKGKA